MRRLAACAAAICAAWLCTAEPVVAQTGDAEARFAAGLAEELQISRCVSLTMLPSPIG